MAWNTRDRDRDRDTNRTCWPHSGTSPVRQTVTAGSLHHDLLRLLKNHDNMRAHVPFPFHSHVGIRV